MQKGDYEMCLYVVDHLEWWVGDWGPCLVADTEMSQMGAGSMDRNVTCVLTSHDSFQVTTSLLFCFFFFFLLRAGGSLR